MIRLENVLKRSLQDVFKTSWISLENVLKTSRKRLEDALKLSWRRFCKTSWRLLEDVLKKFLQDILKTSWKLLEDVLKTSWRRMIKTITLVLIKTSWRRLEDVWVRWIYLSWSRHFEDVLKTSSEDKDERRLQDVFIKTNVCWDVFIVFGAIQAIAKPVCPGYEIASFS